MTRSLVPRITLSLRRELLPPDDLHYSVPMGTDYSLDYPDEGLKDGSLGPFPGRRTGRSRSVQRGVGRGRADPDPRHSLHPSKRPSTPPVFVCRAPFPRFLSLTFHGFGVSLSPSSRDSRVPDHKGSDTRGPCVIGRSRTVEWTKRRNGEVVRAGVSGQEFQGRSGTVGLSSSFGFSSS